MSRPSDLAKVLIPPRVIACNFVRVMVTIPSSLVRARSSPGDWSVVLRIGTDDVGFELIQLDLHLLGAYGLADLEHPGLEA